TEFRIWAFVVATVTSALTYCFLTGSWSGIIGELFIFGFAYWWGMIIASLTLTSRSIVYPILALLSATIIIAYSFNKTTEYKWEERVGAVARDGWISHATGRGAASHHGGVDQGIMQSHSRALSDQERWGSVLTRFWHLLPVFGISSALIMEQCVLGKEKTSQK